MHNKRLKQDEFEVIKKLLQQYSIKEISTLTGRGRTTLSLIKKFDTFEMYQSYTKNKKSLEKKPVENEIVYSGGASIETINFAQLEALIRIADSLDKLINLAEKKKRLF